ncbi:hypothetical protein ACQR35_12870 [Pseudarthrobacter sp. J1738]|uniref:hypothetical protein n=1 Tax=Pseudarthrobacter sp. J1738 TaxID=3420446 RepID=UPI003D2A6B41
MLDPEQDPSGAKHIQHWAQFLRVFDPAKGSRVVLQRMIHPGLDPAAGSGLVSSIPLGSVASAGQTALSLSVLQYLDEESISKDEITDLFVSDNILGGLLTLVSDRMCEVVPEIPPGGSTGLNFFLPIAGATDPQLGAPMPKWKEIDSGFRDALARLSSLPVNEASAISAAIHLHYCASLLLTRDMTGAYALVIAGIETLAMTFGTPPTTWADWDQATDWDKFFASQKLSEEQASAFRGRLTQDRFMRLAETFAKYATETLPEGFWDEPVSDYIWGVQGETGKIIEGAWLPERPRDPCFGANRELTKKAFKKAYQVRSQFMHSGKRPVTSSDDIFGQAPGRKRSVVSFAQARAVLRRLILIELEKRGDPNPAGLDRPEVVAP